jgi:hypothetical protein
MLEERGTIRAKTSGRHSWADSVRRKTHEVPQWRQAKRDWEAESQDEPAYIRGERVRHAIFGTGTIAEIGGNGRDVKATITFDDEGVGQKTIKLAYTKLERE